jgi:hypothetical protein
MMFLFFTDCTLFCSGSAVSKFSFPPYAWIMCQDVRIVLERLRLPLKRKRSLSSEDTDPIKKETKCTYLQMSFGIFVSLLLCIMYVPTGTGTYF